MERENREEARKQAARELVRRGAFMEGTEFGMEIGPLGYGRAKAGATGLGDGRGPARELGTAGATDAEAFGTGAAGTTFGAERES